LRRQDIKRPFRPRLASDRLSLPVHQGEFSTVRLIPLDSGTGVEIRFDRPILLVGRHEECDILLDSRKVSRKHCLVALLGDSLVVRDLGSTNGVQVNGKSVVEARVLSGDELAIGGCRFRLEPEPIEPVSPHGTLQSLLR